MRFTDNPIIFFDKDFFTSNLIHKKYDLYIAYNKVQVIVKADLGG